MDLAGPAGRLEGLLNEGIPDSRFTALICHPHPLGGGTLHNKVVYRAMKVLNAPEWGFGFPVLRFNFRGTGRSEGQHDGTAEIEDVGAALSWLENEYSRPVVVVGFSFGAAMALRACCRDCSAAAGPSPSAQVHALAALGLPTQAADRNYHYGFLRDCDLPKLFLSGEHDAFAPATTLHEAIAASSDPKHMVLIPGADHFFKGHLEPMQQALAGWLEEQVS